MTSKRHRPIGVFDSGLGGLTVVKEISSLLPHEDIIYVGDTARVPYGTKSPETVSQYAREITRFLIKKKVKAIVVACNTASAVALRSLKHLKIPILGVIRPGARAAAHTTRSKRIGIIGTQATMSSGSYQRAIRWIMNNVRIWEQPCPLFVPLVESGWINKKTTEDIAREYLGPILKKKIDTLVLGCTHYPLLKTVLKRVVGKKVQLIDSANETSKDLKKLLIRNNLDNPGTRKGKIVYYVTDDPKSFSRLAQKFLNKKTPQAKRLSLDRI